MRHVYFVTARFDRNTDFVDIGPFESRGHCEKWAKRLYEQGGFDVVASMLGSFFTKESRNAFVVELADPEKWIPTDEPDTAELSAIDIKRRSE